MTPLGELEYIKTHRKKASGRQLDDWLTSLIVASDEQPSDEATSVITLILDEQKARRAVRARKKLVSPAPVRFPGADDVDALIARLNRHYSR